jgi:hypothetical protein
MGATSSLSNGNEVAFWEGLLEHENSFKSM